MDESLAQYLDESLGRYMFQRDNMAAEVFQKFPLRYLEKLHHELAAEYLLEHPTEDGLFPKLYMHQADGLCSRLILKAGMTMSVKVPYFRERPASSCFICQALPLVLTTAGAGLDPQPFIRPRAGGVGVRRLPTVESTA